jgi:hypothetical protein
MAVPETAMYKYNGATGRKNDIRSARQIATMESKA